ncbi:MAG: HNH endonuclease signature motif containing protein [Gammaproteobacteria bacterium]|nr:HNH endonuclease signature motif containing protein [Gammaproteobacteria bacterium]
MRRRVFDRARWRCEACGERGRLECDHIDRGGGDEMENLQALCRSCHIEKTANENRRDDPEGAAMRRLLEGLFD